MVDSVALVRCEGDFGKALKKGVDLIGGLGALKSPCIIKPNICEGEDKTGFAVTNVKVVQALTDLILKKDGSLPIKIVESDSAAKFADEAFEALGYVRLEEQMKKLGFDVSLVNLSHPPMTQTKLDGLYFRDLELATVVTKPSFFVSVAVAKTHGLSFITGTLKNMFGLLPRKNKPYYHPRINDVIVDLNRVVKSDLCIVDARVGLEGWDGPTTRSLNAIIVGKNPVSVDSTMARIMGFNPEKIKHLIESEKFGLGTINPTVLGDSVDSIKVQFNHP